MRAFPFSALLLVFFVSPTWAQEEPGEAFRSIKIVADPAAQASQAQVQRWHEKLRNAKSELEVIDSPLSDALQFVSEQADIPIRVDQRALDDIGVAGDVPVSLNARNISTRSLLRLLLQELDLTYLVDSTGVVVTTWEVAESRLVRRVYPVSDLIHEGPLSDPDILIGVITSSVEAHLWEHLGGPGSISCFQKSLIVDSTDLAHRNIESLLTRLREVKELSSDSYTTASVSVFPSQQQSADLEAKLNSTHVPIEFIDVSLEEVTDFLSDVSEIPIHLDRRSLSDVGYSTDLPITIQAKELSVKQTLTILCQQHDLGWHPVDGMIVMTSSTYAQRAWEIRVYPVRDLVWHGLDIRDPELRQQLWQATRSLPSTVNHAAGRANLKTTDLPKLPDFGGLVDSITTAIEPETWEHLGGPGSITYYPMCDCLVVRHHRAMHEKVAELLHQLRSQENAVDTETLTQQIEQIRSQLLTVKYVPYQVTDTSSDFTREDFQAIGRQVEQLIVADTWNSDDYFILATQAGLIIRHTREVHEKIGEFLDQVGIGLPAPSLSSDRSPVNAHGSSGPNASSGFDAEAQGMGSPFQNSVNGQQGGFF
ncbi:hypothetical protein [Bremerella sp. P1]|uniref:hypothetical protein n=1 Tax=Bremerella sp. P1 TaxID=3026424 RepID=UPI0023681B39|nr:hypothetical protein [Bremerella sp. P1]WDI43099.1 hypothetical protein PSR63_03955 [Bremerella sp. P1]